MNRLGDQSSPYLRQHKDNPVDWFPWGDDAFAAARADDKPILLSVGYSACHWCHVMAHESFQDPDTAAVMNEHFVNVKVDREERPDVDAIYMEAVQAMTGRGGWPMTVFLTPEGEPFFGGTYFPPEPRHGMPSFVELMERVHEAWATQRDDLVDQAERLTGAIGRSSRIAADDRLPSLDLLDFATGALRRQFDAAWGGFGRAPKFPQAMTLEALLRVVDRTGDDDTLAMVTTTLDAMASGGMYDHLGGGFARYSVDDRWMVPHFEKMLYDNALLARVYLHAWQITGKPRYRQVLDETISYVLRDLTDAAGGFYSAEDADSEGEEGKFYVFTPDEVRDILGDDAPVALEWYGITDEGNFEGKSIPWRPVRGDLIRPADVEAVRIKLLDARNGRPRPGLDDKVLTEWNALFLAVLAEAAAATGNAAWRTAAVTNGEFLLAHLRRSDGRWMRSWQAGDDARPAQAQHLAYAHDYAALVDAFTRLAEATGEARWIVAAQETAADLIDLFWDDAEGGVFTTGTDAEELITRPKDIMDNATPSANSLAAHGLLRLAALTGHDDLRSRAEAVLRLVGGVAADHPTAFGHLLCSVDLLQRGAVEVAVVGDRPDLVTAVAAAYRPTVVLAWGEPYDSPLWHERRDGLAYVCRDFACQAPTADADELRSQLAAA